MKDNSHESAQSAGEQKLRKLAEAQLKQKHAKASLPEIGSLDDTKKLLEELQIHQVELVMQNEELKRAQAEIIFEREKYADLYHFAPVAYFIFDDNDIILDLNMKACELLGYDRAYLLNRPLTAYISPDSLQTFHVHRQHVRLSGVSKTCELQIRRKPENPVFVHARTTLVEQPQYIVDDGELADGQKLVWRTVMTNITVLRQVTRDLARSRNLLMVLSQGSQAVHLATTPEEVYRAVGEQTEHLGSELGIFSLGEKNELRLSYTTLSENILNAIAQDFGQSVDELSLPVLEGGFLAHVIATKETQYRGAPDNFQVLGADTDAVARTNFLVGLFNIKQMIVAPLVLDEEVVALLMVIGDKLEQSDVAVVDIFASQVAISLHKAQLAEELRASVERERALARVDSLTGAKNRRAIYEFAEETLDVAKRYKKPLSLIMLDTDYFKKVNDTYGHLVGDHALQHLVGLLKSKLRAADDLGRYGGEEFLIVLPETDEANAAQLAERLRLLVEQNPLVDNGDEVFMTISLGVIQWHSALRNFESFLNGADQALYAAKTAGRNKVVTYTEYKKPLEGFAIC